MTETVKGVTATASASRYLQQLCKHWAHKADTEFDPLHGTIRFASGEVIKMTAEPERLLIDVSSATADTAASFAVVVENHIARFAFREALSFTWQAVDATA